MNCLSNLIHRAHLTFHQFSSGQLLSRVQVFATWWIAARQAPCPSPTPRVYSNSCSLSRWCQLMISSSVIPFSSHLQSFPASGSFFFMVSHIKLFNHLNKSTIKIKMNKSTNNCFCFCFFHKKLDLLGNNSHVLVIMW